MVADVRQALTEDGTRVTLVTTSETFSLIWRTSSLSEASSGPSPSNAITKACELGIMAQATTSL